jgi:hypothetical protein
MLMRKAAIAGIGSTPFGRHPETPIEEFAARRPRQRNA